MIRKIYILTSFAVLCCLLFGACGSGIRASASVEYSSSASAQASVPNVAASENSPIVSPAVSAAINVNDFRPEFFKGKDTAEVVFMPELNSKAGIEFVFEPQGYEIELSVSAGQIWDGNVFYPTNSFQGKDYRFPSGSNHGVCWDPIIGNEVTDTAPAAEINFTAYLNGTALVQGTIDMTREDDPNLYRADIIELKEVSE